MWQILYHIVTRLCTLCHLLSRRLCHPNIYSMPHASPVQPQGYVPTYNWIYTISGSARTCTWAMASLPADRTCREAPGAVKGVSYLSLSSGVLNRTSSHICGSWYLPMFLFRVGSFSLMNKPSFIVPVRFYGFLPIILKLSTLV